MVYNGLFRKQPCYVYPSALDNRAYFQICALLYLPNLWEGKICHVPVLYSETSLCIVNDSDGYLSYNLLLVRFKFSCGLDYSLRNNFNNNSPEFLSVAVTLIPIMATRIGTF